MHFLLSLEVPLRIEGNVDKQEWTYPLSKRAWKESQIDWIVCIIYAVCWNEDFILGIYNIWCEIHVESKLH